jgi:hypothetical protein
MLKLTDLGCVTHERRQLTLDGTEAELIRDILYNLPRAGDFHTFICEHGHTHRVSFHIRRGKWYPVMARFPEEADLLGDRDKKRAM